MFTGSRPLSTEILYVKSTVTPYELGYTVKRILIPDPSFQTLSKYEMSISSY